MRGAQITDNHVTWLATSNLYGSNGYGNHITGQFPYNGLEQVRLEGDPSAFAAQNSITAAFTNSAGNTSTSNSMGIHLLRATATDVSGGSYYGSALNKKNDLGGLVVDDSFHTKITNFQCQFAHQNLRPRHQWFGLHLSGKCRGVRQWRLDYNRRWSLWDLE